MTRSSPRIHLSPVVVGLIAAVLAALLIVIGIARGSIPVNPHSLAVAFLLGAGSWGVIAWAIAQAAVDVETDLVQVETREIEQE